MSVDWSRDGWGKAPGNVHVSETGSDVPDRHDAGSGGEH